MTDGETTDYDVVMMTDCRFPGGTVSSVVEETIAQTRAGYRTGIIHFPSSVLTYPRPFNPKIRRCVETGLADLIIGTPEVRTRLLLMRHPSIFSELPEDAPSIVADRRVLAVNQVPEDDRGEERYYDIHAIADNLDDFLGDDVLWSPIGPRVRESLAPYTGRIPITEMDWENIVDVDAWTVERDGFVGDRPVLGRHSRGHWTKWPDDADDILAAWPDDDRYVVKALGGTRPPERILGGLPDNWISYPFNSLSPQEFLSEIDFLVYYHHPGLIEAFGRVVLEGLAAGAVAVIPEYFRELFGDACRYGTPQDVRAHVDELYADPAAYAELSRRGLELARSRFSYDTHVQRIRDLIGEPSGFTPPDVAAASPSASGPVVLFVDPADGETSEIALRLAAEREDRTRLVYLTSPARAERARDLGAATEILGSPSELGLSDDDWERRVSARLSRMIDAHNPRTVVVVGDSLPPGLKPTASAHQDVRFVWLTSGSPRPRDPQLAALDLVIDATALDGGDEGAVPRTMRTIEAATDATMRRIGRELTWASVEPAARTGAGDDQGGDRAPATLIERFRAFKSEVGERLPRLRLWLWRSRTYRRRLARELRALQRKGLRRIEVRAQRARMARQERDQEVEEVEPTVGAGRIVRDADVADAPVAMVVIWDITDGDLDGLVERVAVVQQMTSEFRPLFVTTGTDTDAFRRFGYLVERVLPADEYSRLHGAVGWDDYVHERLRDLARTYRPGHVAMIDGEHGLDHLDVSRLSKLLRPPTIDR